jgi:hypothetical protein
VVLRLKLDENLPQRAEQALSGLVKLGAIERPAGQLWVIDERRVRIRD